MESLHGASEMDTMPCASQASTQAKLCSPPVTGSAPGGRAEASGRLENSKPKGTTRPLAAPGPHRTEMKHCPWWQPLCGGQTETPARFEVLGAEFPSSVRAGASPALTPRLRPHILEKASGSVPLRTEIRAEVQPARFTFQTHFVSLCLLWSNVQPER